MIRHQYIDRTSGRLVEEKLYQDALVSFVYNRTREQMPRLFKALTSAHFSCLLGYINFDAPWLNSLIGPSRLAERLGVDLSECLDEITDQTTARQLFERRIRYWETRPLPSDERALVSPADARVLFGSLAENSNLFIKEKFFSLDELLGGGTWPKVFTNGDFAVFRLTPDKYHYNHLPVSGRVVDYFMLDGAFIACNPEAVVTMVTPYSKNRRAVTIIDTDIEGGSGVGMVAMIEVVAMMIGEIRQAYSAEYYAQPTVVRQGMLLKKGQPKSLYRPGSSTDILLFSPDRIRFADDLLQNQTKSGSSRFSSGFGRPLLETEIKVRSLLAWPADYQPRPPGNPITTRILP